MPAVANKIETVNWEVVPDSDPDPSYLEQEGWEDRLEAYRDGEFGFVGVRAVAEIVVAGTMQTIASPGLWGIEDDSGDEYLREVAGEEMETLRAILAEMGLEDDDERFTV